MPTRVVAPHLEPLLAVDSCIKIYESSSWTTGRAEGPRNRVQDTASVMSAMSAFVRRVRNRKVGFGGALKGGVAKIVMLHPRL